MAYTGTYCSEDDLIFGDVELGTNRDTLVKKHIDLASKDIEATLGSVYVIPIQKSDVSPQGWLLLNKIAYHLATGRLLMEIDQAGEDTKVHDYALYLLQQANAALQSIVEGDVNLRPTDENANLDSTRQKVLVNNLDGYSQVESFYGWAATTPPWYLRGGVIPYGR